MSTEEERKDLIENPLPVDAMVFASCPAVEVLQNIVYLTEVVEATQKHVDYLHKQLDILKGRAISENIKESGNYYLIEIPGKKMRNKINVSEFKALHEYEYKRIRLHQFNNLFEKFTRDRDTLEESDIPLTVADKVVGSNTITEFVGYQPQKITIEVRQRQGLIK